MFLTEQSQDIEKGIKVLLDNWLATPDSKDDELVNNLLLLFNSQQQKVAGEKYEEILKNSRVYNGYGDKLIHTSDLRKIFGVPEPENPGC